MKYASSNIRSMICFIAIVIASINPFIANSQVTEQEITLAPDTADRLFIMFSARAPAISPLSPGHAFVSWGKTDATSNSCVTNTYGFYPCDNCTVLSDDHPGRVVKGFNKNRNNKRLKWFSIRTDSQHLEQTSAVIEKWQKTQYHLIQRNCVRFMSEMAASQGLETPKTTYLGFIPKFPKQYIRQLERANPGKTIFIADMNEDGIPYCLDENNNGVPDKVEVIVQN
jgi:hypothetical protein